MSLFSAVLVLLASSVGCASSANTHAVRTDGSFTLGVKNTPVDATSAASWKQFLAQPFADADGEAAVYELGA